MAKKRLRHRIRDWFRRHRADRIEFAAPLGHWHTRPTLVLSPCLEPAHKDACWQAITWWRERTSAGLFYVAAPATMEELLVPEESALAGLPTRNRVGIVSEAPFSPGDRAHAELFFATDAQITIKGAHVRIRPGLCDDVLMRTVAHELGHILGLAHPRGNDDRYLMDTDGKGFLLLKQELQHAKSAP